MTELTQHIAFEIAQHHETPRTAADMWRNVQARMQQTQQQQAIAAQQHSMAEAEQQQVRRELSRRVSL